jgi:hypothetical protein
LLEEQMWAERMKIVKAAMTNPDEEYLEETRWWQDLSADALKDQS